MSSPTARAADNKREEFRRYLERVGVMDLLTRAMFCLYEEPEKPDDPVRYICDILGHSCPEQPSVDALRSELEEAKAELERLRQEVTALRSSPGGAQSEVENVTEGVANLGRECEASSDDTECGESSTGPNE